MVNMKLCLFGDYVPGVTHKYMVDMLMQSDFDYICANLEAPLRECSEKRSKSGRHLNTILEPIKPISDQLILTLANNHMMDYGVPGLEATKAEINDAGALFMGAGSNLDDAEKSIVIEKNGKKIAFLARCETQFGVASNDRPGVAPLSARIYQQIKELKSQVDYLVLSVHGGAEMFPLPSPAWQDRMRSYVDAGADVVHGHHAHVPQGFEHYKDAFIFYGLGNFMVSPQAWANTPNALWSLAPKLEFTDNGISLDMRVAELKSESNQINLNIQPLQGSRYEEYLLSCEKILQDRQLLESVWQEISMRLYKGEFSKVLRFPEGNKPYVELRFSKRLKNFYAAFRTLLSGKLYKDVTSTQNQLLHWYHLFACESHADAMTTALGVLSNELSDKRSCESSSWLDKLIEQQ